jgi:putative oxidoreductase
MQRLVVGAAVLYCAVAAATSTFVGPHIIAAVAGLLLIAGLWTPIAGVVMACAEAWVAISSPAHAGIPVALAVLGVSLALIGPGEWSVDARIYGRRRFIPPQL